jgi:thimet oligopeptidase
LQILQGFQLIHGLRNWTICWFGDTFWSNTLKTAAETHYVLANSTRALETWDPIIMTMLRTSKTISLSASALSVALVLSVYTPAIAQGQTSVAKETWDFNLPADELTSLCEATLSAAEAAFIAIEKDTSVATLESVFGAFDAVLTDLQPIQHTNYLSNVHPSVDIREAAQACSRDLANFRNSHSLSRKFYERIAAIDTSDLSAAEIKMIEDRLRNSRLSGVDRDDATRERVGQLKREITEIGNAFDNTIREDVRYVDTNLAELDGLPQDYIDNHPADENGVIRISTNTPDLNPVLSYSRNDDLRRRLFIASNNRGMPANTENLKQLISKRYELAQLLGYETYAAMAMDGLMIQNPENAERFLRDIGAALEVPVKNELDVLLQRLRVIDPVATRVEAWQRGYLSNLIRQEDYALDSQEVRQYFRFSKVQNGIFQLTEDLFDVEIIPWETETWHESVSSWEIRRSGEPISRFYLDLHPRDGKYQHAAQWSLRRGLKEGQIPVSALATNFPNGLMEHRQVTTFLHEFGHLLHNTFAGTQSWLSISGMSMERDFVEAPSQMLEEWVWDYDSLSKFATNDAGEVIPRTLVDKMANARYFGRATGTAMQIYFANISLNFYQTPPSEFEPLPLTKSLSAQYSPYPYVEGTHFYAAFGHLNGYSSNYYIYQWSLAIATEMFSRFQQAGLRDEKVAHDYRDKVLGSAGSRPANEFVEDFLGRTFSTQAYIDFLTTLN